MEKVKGVIRRSDVSKLPPEIQAELRDKAELQEALSDKALKIAARQTPDNPLARVHGEEDREYLITSVVAYEVERPAGAELACKRYARKTVYAQSPEEAKAKAIRQALGDKKSRLTSGELEAWGFYLTFPGKTEEYVKRNKYHYVLRGNSVYNRNGSLFQLANEGTIDAYNAPAEREYSGQAMAVNAEAVQDVKAMQEQAMKDHAVKMQEAKLMIDKFHYWQDVQGDKMLADGCARDIKTEFGIDVLAM